MKSALAWLLALFAATPACADVRALFVGIDHYQFSTPADFPGGIHDLTGAVGDVGRIKQALRDAYGVNLDPGPTRDCRSSNQVSITLIDRCADRQSILDALADRIKASKAGDTLIFYFAGHGSRYYERGHSEQASQYNDTIVPSDARKPGDPVNKDILDRELRIIIDGAASRNVHVWTIFDSCSSGTATRDLAAVGAPRSAPAIEVDRVVPVSKDPPLMGNGQGYRVHFAAAADGEEAREIGSAGIFTTALVKTLADLPHATFDDIATETALKVAASGHTTQTPQAEGALDATFGGARNRTVVLRGRPDAGGVMMAGGMIEGVTVGSAYAIYGQRIDALNDKAKPLATGHVTQIGSAESRIVLDSAPAGAFPASLALRETRHAFGDRIVPVGLKLADEPRRALVTAAMAAVPSARLTPTEAPYYLTDGIDGDPRIRLCAADGHCPAVIGKPDDPAFAGRLGTALTKIAHVEAMLALRTPGQADARFCIDCADPRLAPPPEQTWRRPPVLTTGTPVDLVVGVSSETPRWVYVFAIDQDYAVQLALPQNDGQDPQLSSMARPLRAKVGPNTPGLYRFVVVASDAPINAQALEQTQAGARDPMACRPGLEQLLCEAATGSRDPAAPRVGTWTAQVFNVLVKEPRP